MKALIFLLFLFLAACTAPDFEGQSTSTGSCLPGSDICIESCAKGTPARCANPGGSPRTCDCDHPWNQGTTNTAGSFD